MSGGGSNGQCFGWETLHAAAAGEVDPAQRAAIDAHLSRCDTCSENFERAKSMLRVLGGMQPEQPDDLAWQRMSRRVLASLEAHAANELPRRAHHAVYWMAGTAVAAAAIACAVWLAPYAPALAPKEIESAAAPTIAAGDTTFQLSLSSGSILRLSPHAQTRLVRDQRSITHLELVQGELQLETPLPYSLPQIEVQTAAFRAFASARRFTIAQLASEVIVTVASGEVRLEGEGVDQVVGEGERFVLPLAPATLRTELHAQKQEAAPQKPPAPEPPAQAPALPEKRRTKSKQRAPEVSAPAPSADPIIEEPTTNVEVTAPSEPTDPWQAALAAYESGDLQRAIELSEQVLVQTRSGPERRQALWILCEARLVRGDAARAVHACSALADSEPDPEAARALHYRIASMYRTRLGDCAQAIAHYGRVIVFGQQSFLDDQALLGRAACALELRQFGVAERDLETLSTRLLKLEGRDSYIDLVERLEAAKAQRKRDAGR